jgi:hypothetical protein
MIRDPEIEKNWCVSTTHISQQDADILGDCAAYELTPGGPTFKQAGGPIVYDYPEGFFVYVPRDQDHFNELIVKSRQVGLSESFVQLLRAARRLVGVKFIHLDRDGPRCDELEKHEW